MIIHYWIGSLTYWQIARTTLKGTCMCSCAFGLLFIAFVLHIYLFIVLLSHVKPYARISRLMSETHEQISEKPPHHFVFSWSFWKFSVAFSFSFPFLIWIFIFHLKLLLCELSKHVKVQVQVLTNILMRVRVFPTTISSIWTVSPTTHLQLSAMWFCHEMKTFFGTRSIYL